MELRMNVCWQQLSPVVEAHAGEDSLWADAEKCGGKASAARDSGSSSGRINCGGSKE